MANTIRVPRARLILGICMPLAVLLGYFLAEPLAKAAFFFLVFGALYVDFYTFAGLLGFSASLNGWPAARSEAEASAAPALATFS
jgi:hypothetical protein